jgi:hypothetical protein
MLMAPKGRQGSVDDMIRGLPPRRIGHAGGRAAAVGVRQRGSQGRRRIEWDGQLPGFERLLQERQRAQALLASHAVPA